MNYDEDDKRTREEILEARNRRLSEPIVCRVVGHREPTEEEKKIVEDYLKELAENEKKNS
jgi:3-methyladenine DNA glycosylase AlkD